ncbi:MAG: transglutaminase family protein [Cyanobacteria bacterium J06632_22]
MSAASVIADPDLSLYLMATPLIDRQPAIVALASALSQGCTTDVAVAKNCFEWVRDQVRHSVDYRLNPVTCRASDVLAHRTGYCYAKSHLLAALLRANGIPAGFCYQRLSIGWGLDKARVLYCLHGLNAVYLQAFGWYRVDPRGNRSGIDAQFTPPVERLAFSLDDSGERTFPEILPAPLVAVVQALTQYSTWQDVLNHLPDACCLTG